MKLTFLGTGAGEGYPGFWCRCPHCTYARVHGGRNIRAHSCALVDETLILDMGPNCMERAARLGLDMTQATTLLITHPHEDHLYAKQLAWRAADEACWPADVDERLRVGGPRVTEVPLLHVYGNAFTMALLRNDFAEPADYRMALHTVREGHRFTSGGYTITPVRGHHGEDGFAHSYIVEKDAKTLLYALDTGMPAPDSFALLGRHRFDAVVVEGTTGLNVQYGTHMCMETDLAFRARLLEMGCADADTRFVLSHMSPHNCPPHDVYAPMMAQHGFTVAYDGMVLTV